MITTVEFQELIGVGDVDVCAEVDTAERQVLAMSVHSSETKRAVFVLHPTWVELEMKALDYADEMRW